MVSGVRYCGRREDGLMQPAGTQLIAHLAQQAAIGHAFVAAREPGVEEFGFPSAAMCAGKSLQCIDLFSGRLVVLRHSGELSSESGLSTGG